jgi:hypothetical protein
LRLATLPIGRILTQAGVFGLNIGSLPNATARLRRETFSDSEYDFLTSRSSGASIMTCRSITSATPKNGIRPKIQGDIKGRDCLVRYRRGKEVLGVASIYRDVENLKEEAAMERRVGRRAREWVA